MPLALFWIFALLMLAFGAGVVLLRNPVSSALSLVMSFIFLAALFFTLEANFIGIVQILVYAGAVMVLFLFIIMLLDIRAEQRRQFNLPALVGGAVVLVGFVGVLFEVVRSAAALTALPKPVLATTSQSDVFLVGQRLFSSFNLPFQIVGVLLLVATVGVVMLSKKELK